MKQEYTEPVFVFCGSAEKIAKEQAMVSHFRKQNGVNLNPQVHSVDCNILSLIL